MKVQPPFLWCKFTSQWQHEISLPLVIPQDGSQHHSQVEKTDSSTDVGELDLIENIRIKAKHITLLESELLISGTQLTALASRLNTLEVHSRNIEIANDSLNTANNLLGEENPRFILEINAVNSAHNARRRGLLARIRNRFSATLLLNSVTPV